MKFMYIIIVVKYFLNCIYHLTSFHTLLSYSFFFFRYYLLLHQSYRTFIDLQVSSFFLFALLDFIGAISAFQSCLSFRVPHFKCIIHSVSNLGANTLLLFSFCFSRLVSSYHSFCAIVHYTLPQLPTILNNILAINSVAGGKLFTFYAVGISVIIFLVLVMLLLPLQLKL